jgi:hypothetical protein
MKFLRYAFLTAFVLSGAASAFGQKSLCALKEAPEFREFRLGMTMLEVRGNLEDTTLFDINTPSGGTGSHAVRISAAELKEKLAEGIDEINLAFVDGKLAVIKVNYNGAMTWTNAQDFLVKVSETLGIPKPPASESSRSRGNEKYKVECKTFAVTLAYSFGNSPNFTINDLAAQKLADQRLDDARDTRTISISPNTTRKP